jgi:hypothetical protein
VGVLCEQVQVVGGGAAEEFGDFSVQGEVGAGGEVGAECGDLRGGEGGAECDAHGNAEAEKEKDGGFEEEGPLCGAVVGEGRFEQEAEQQNGERKEEEDFVQQDAEDGDGDCRDEARGGVAEEEQRNRQAEKECVVVAEAEAYEW